MNRLIEFFNEKYGDKYGKISYPRTTLQIYRVYQTIKSYGIEDNELIELLHKVELPKPRNTEEWELYVCCLYNMDDSELEKKVKDAPKKTIVEDNKLYLVKSDGTKIDEGTELPSIDVSKEYVDTSLENKVDKVTGKGLSTVDFTKSYETKLKGLENYNDTKVKEDIKTINTQLGDIANELGKNEDGSDIVLKTTDKTVKGAINEVFQNVSNGKKLIATAITDKGVETNSDATFQVMANNISKIETNVTKTDISNYAVSILSKNKYTGSEITPTVTIEGLTENTDFTVSYENNINVGDATATITGTGNYEGTIIKK